MKTMNASKTFKSILSQRRQVAKKFDGRDRVICSAIQENVSLKICQKFKSLRLCAFARGIFFTFYGILIYFVVINSAPLFAQSQDAEMSSSRYAITRSAIVGAGGYVSSSSFLLQHQFSLPNLGKMEGGNFVVGTAVELKLVQSDETPTSYSMSQNYPNPFNQSTTFVYTLPEKSDITISVYSMLGQEIAVLVYGEQEAGLFNLKYDGLDGWGRPLPSGLYFCRLTSQKGFDKTIKFAILR